MRKIAFAVDEYYHLYNRGVEKRQIYLDRSDNERFLKLLFFCNSSNPVNLRDLPKSLAFVDYLETRGEPLVDIGAFCLMPNHFHLLVREKSEKGITIFMHKLMTAYTKYFNAKNERRGRLFEGTFYAKHADTDEYLRYLFSYIHLNPIKIIDPNWQEAGIQDLVLSRNFLQEYNFSSFQDYSGNIRDYSHILNKARFPAYFPSETDFTNSIFEWLDTYKS